MSYILTGVNVARPILLGAFLTLLAGAAAAGPVSIIPQPVSVEPHPGSFRLHGGVALAVSPDTAETRRAADYFVNAIAPATGFHLKVSAASASARSAGIVLALAAARAGEDHPEGYRLKVGERAVRIEASSAAGLFYGVQTLLQLFPPQIESASQSDAAWTAPCLEIADYPRFAWRGLMVDVSRHFFTKQEVEHYIDRMARYKFNVLHWRLTDDQGWRIEIKSEPKLTEVGAWRVPRQGRWWHIEPPVENEPATYGGFYTQDDVREVIAYAGDRFITVVPEIEMPGHSMAALAAYPELSCTGGPFHVNPGSKFYRQEDNALCPGNEKTFEFLDHVLGEVAALFPSVYIHIGGDEAFKGFWKKCPRRQRRIADEHLKDEDELQSYLIRRAEKMLQAKGNRLIGWDEILEGGLAPSATVMSWRGTKGGIAAAQQNHQVIMTPNDFTYLDLYQGDPAIEPDTYSELRLSKVYRFEPVPDGVDPASVLGGQGNLWTESAPTLRHAEYMTWPRSFALAEALWSAKSARNWDDFMGRTEAQFARFDAANINYSRAVYQVIVPERDAAGKMALRMTSELDNTAIYYTFDGTNPDRFAPQYRGEPLAVPAGAYMVRAIAYRNSQPGGRMLSVGIDELKDRLEKQKK